LLKDNITTDRPSRKLDHQMLGPYQIAEKRGYSYELKLLEAFKGIHNVFYASLLHKYLGDPLLGQHSEPPPTVSITGNDEEHELTDIRACKLRYGKLKYRGNWMGWDEHPSWYPASDFKYAPHLLRSFHLANPTLPGPPAMLPDWLKAYEAGEDNYDHLDGKDLPMSKAARTRFFGRGG
jgi:hypothetical protein